MLMKADEPADDGDEPDSRRGALLGALVVLIIVAVGLYLVHVLHRTARLQDCVMSGRTNCAPIDPRTGTPLNP